MRHAPLEGRLLALVFTGLLIGNTMAGLDATVVATAGPTIAGELGALKLLPWVFTAYQIAQIAVMPLYGKLGDLLGRRSVFAASVLIFTVGSMLCGAAPNMTAFIVFRIVQGMGAGGLTGLTMALVADLVPPERLGRYLGYTGFVFAATSVLGPLAGGLFTDHLSWRFAFYVNLPSAAICLVALRWVPRGARRPRPIDWSGAALLACAVATGVLALSWGGVQYAWGSAEVRGLFAVCAVTFVAFVWWERRAPEPVVPPRIFRARQVGISVFANLVAGIAFFGAIVYLPVYFQGVTSATATSSGMLLIPFALSTAIGTVVVGQFVERHGGAKVFPFVGFLLSGAGFALLATLDAQSGVVLATILGALVGLGVGFVMQVMLFVVQRSVAAEDIGAATAAAVLGRILGAVVGVAVLGNVFNRASSKEIAHRLVGVPRDHVRADRAALAKLAPPLQRAAHDAFAAALHPTYRITIPIMLLGAAAIAWIPKRAALAVRTSETSGVDSVRSAHTIDATHPAV